jgi:hypothetical protein
VGRASLAGVDLKLNRAQQHLYALSADIITFLRDPDTYAMVAEFDEQRRPILRLGEEARQPPPDWGVVIGECVYNFHSALDHLALQLAVANTRGRLPKTIAESSAFPIFSRGTEYRARGLRRIRGMSLRAQAIIERLQPYHRWKNPGARALWQLHELSNIDKHRLLHVTHSSLEGSQFRITSARPMTFSGYSFYPGPLKPGAVIARWHVVVPPGQALKVDVNANLVTDVAFGKSSPARSVRGVGVIPTLQAIGAFVADSVLPPLTAEIGLTSTFKPGRYIDVFTATDEDLREIRERTGEVTSSLGVLRTVSPIVSSHPRRL